jgi:TP901 family phage tail tape measure protein
VSQNLKLEVLLTAINKATAPLKAITKGSTETAKALKAARDNLRGLNDQQKNLDGFRKLDKDIAITKNSLIGATDKIKQLKLEMAAVDKPTAAMNKAFNKAVKEAGGLKKQHNDLILKQQQLRTQLHGAGMDTKSLSDHQRTLKTNLANATAQVAKQTDALKKQSEIASRMNAAKRVRDDALSKRNAIAGAGAQAVGTGVAMGLPILKVVKDYAVFETAMLGVAKQMDGARDSNGKLTKSYYEMSDSIKDMSERLPLTAIEIANLVEGAARMGIQGKQNLLTFTEQTAIMAAAFDLPTDQVAEDIGMISNLYKIPISNIHEFGDAINWLDDNAQSKGGDIIDVMKRIAGTATTAGMNFKDAAALGSSFLSLGASAETAATASNAMINRLSNAPVLASSKRYASGLEMLGLEAIKLQKAMSSDATGTIVDVLERIKALPKDKQLEAATRLFGVEYGDDASKLAQNLEEYRRQLKLTKEAQAAGSMARESSAQISSLEAQATMAKSAIANTSAEIGQQLKPALVDILNTIKEVTIGIRNWVKEHPVLTGFIVKAIAAIAILSIGIGGLLLTIAGILGPMIAMRFIFSAIGIKGGLLIPILRGVGTAIMFIGRMLLLNPIGLAVTAIAGAAYLIYKNWEPIKEWFSNLWDGITKRFYAFIEPIKKALAEVKDFFDSRGGNTLATIGSNNNSTMWQNDLLIKPSQPIKAKPTTTVQQMWGAPVINVHPSPGMNEEQLGKVVAKEISKTNDAAQARNRSLLRDRE